MQIRRLRGFLLFIFAALERHWSWAAGFVGYQIPNFPQGFWPKPAPQLNHAPRPTDFNFSPEAASGAVPSPRHLRFSTKRRRGSNE